MKKYLVIGNPIDHSFSPALHNYWIKQYKINAIYEKRKLEEEEIKNLIAEVKEQKIFGVNVTVPFKNKIIPFLDNLSPEAQATQSVNTIYLENNKVIGHNTDIDGFMKSLVETSYKMEGKKIFILGSGGVVSSLIFALNKMNVSKIIISNRTQSKAENLKNLFKDIYIIEWGKVPSFDVIINATSLGLNDNDKIELDFSSVGKNKFFYDIIYNPKETEFLKLGKKLGNKTENGMMMFVYQAQKSFQKWFKVNPKVDQKVMDLLND